MTLTNENDWIRDFANITNWHKAGYTGKGIKLGTAENVHNERVLRSNEDEYHDWITGLVAKEVAPDIELVHISFATTKSRYQETLDNIAKSGAIGMFRSLSNTYNPEDEFDEYFGEYAPEYFTILNSAGNYDKERYAKNIELLNVYGIGAAHIKYPDCDIVPEIYSSESEHVDFTGLAKLWIDGGQFSGTSCAAPFIAGMVCLIQQKCYEDTGKYLHREELYNFLKLHCIDLTEIEGHDIVTGWGIPILPDPDSIDWSEYMFETDVLEKFTDKNTIHEYGIKAMNTMVKNGIINGKSDTILAPNDNLTRTEMSVILERYNTILEEKLGIKILL